MQDDAVEVAFCELCGTSVPIADLTIGSATRHQGKTIGACCLPSLRGTPPSPSLAAAPASLAANPARPNGETRLLPVAVVMLVAVAAATLFLDFRLTTAAGEAAQWRSELVQVRELIAADSQVLAALAVTMDAVPRRADLLDLGAKLAEASGAGATAQSDLQKQLDALKADIASLAATQRSLAIDYRPLLEDLRQRQLRTLEAVSAVRAAPVVDSTPVVPTPAPESAPADASAPTLPPALLEQVKKLTAGEPATRFEGVDELLRSKDPLVLPSLLPMVKDADAFVRRLTVEGIGQWKRAEVVEALLTALADTDEYVRETAWRSLKEVTSQKIAFEATGTKDARARGVQRWQEWWDKNKATFGS